MESVFWVDKIADEVIERERVLGRSKILRTEMGLGASGIPHVGSAGDGIRSFVVNLALKDRKMESEFIAFSDDMDGLRKIPATFPSSLKEDIGKSVSSIEDPFGCHENYGAHVSSLLIDAFEKLGVEFHLKAAHEEYKKGTLDKQIIKILENAKQCGEIIHRITGQTKYLEQLPFLPVCKNCGKLYTTTAYRYDGKIHYKCDASFKGKDSNTGETIEIIGCGHEDVAGIHDGKLAWKVEFASRWDALKINYEAYGKDILDSVKCNDAICKEILGWDPPLHSFYELFTERSGKKISKSAGNVFTPSDWIRYASPESLRLLYLKRLGTTRVVDPDAIPAYMDELDELSLIYIGKKKVENKNDFLHMKRLYEYVHYLKTKEPKIIVPYTLLARLVWIAKDGRVVKDVLQRTDHIPRSLTFEEEEEIDRRLKYAENWVKDTSSAERVELRLTERQKSALRTLSIELRKREWDEESLKEKIYDIPRNENISQQEFFKAAYLTLLESERGPRLVPFILVLGPNKVADLIDRALE